ncbi:MAG: signal peptidase I [Pseudomonadota bacterium]|nr:signal peptidase I [Pseudomonadota bacterium]
MFDEYKILALIIVIIFAGRSSFLDWNHVSTGSMRPAIIEGDRVVIDKRAYDLTLPFTSWKLANIGSPSRGEIIIFKKHDNPQLLIKRIVGLPGETIEIANNKVRVNDVQADYRALHKKGFNHLDLYTRTNNDFKLEVFEDAAHQIMVQKETNDHPSSSIKINIPDGYYFVLGDNRSSSIDSRNIGLIPREHVFGRARAVAFSVDYDNFYLLRKERFFKDLD